MSATATYNSATKIITVASNGLPSPVAHGTFPNDNNPNQPYCLFVIKPKLDKLEKKGIIK